MINYKFNKKRIYSNVNRQNKWLGLIDYKTLWVIGIYLSIVFFILSKIDIELQIKIYIFGFLSLPISAMFVCSDINQDSVFDMFKVIIIFFIKRAIYVKEKNKINLRKKRFNKYKNIKKIVK